MLQSGCLRVRNLITWFIFIEVEISRMLNALLDMKEHYVKHAQDSLIPPPTMLGLSCISVNYVIQLQLKEPSSQLTL